MIQVLVLSRVDLERRLLGALGIPQSSASIGCVDSLEFDQKPKLSFRIVEGAIFSKVLRPKWHYVETPYCLVLISVVKKKLLHLLIIE